MPMINTSGSGPKTVLLNYQTRLGGFYPTDHSAAIKEVMAKHQMVQTYNAASDKGELRAKVLKELAECGIESVKFDSDVYLGSRYAHESHPYQNSTIDTEKLYVSLKSAEADGTPIKAMVMLDLSTQVGIILAAKLAHVTPGETISLNAWTPIEEKTPGVFYANPSATLKRGSFSDGADAEVRVPEGFWKTLRARINTEAEALKASLVENGIDPQMIKDVVIKKIKSIQTAEAVTLAMISHNKGVLGFAGPAERTAAADKSTAAAYEVPSDQPAPGDFELDEATLAAISEASSLADSPASHGMKVA